MPTAEPAQLQGARDFDFIHGRWNVVHRRLKERWVGCGEWHEFAGTSAVVPLLGGIGNLEEITMPEQGFIGITLRLFDPVAGEWSLYWASSRTGVLCPPVVGRFDAGRGEFYGDDEDEGKPVRVRFLWTVPGPGSARWEQAFSVDGGRGWETNWTMDFTRTGDTTPLVEG